MKMIYVMVLMVSAISLGLLFWISRDFKESKQLPTVPNFSKPNAFKPPVFPVDTELSNLESAELWQFIQESVRNPSSETRITVQKGDKIMTRGYEDKPGVFIFSTLQINEVTFTESGTPQLIASYELYKFTLSEGMAKKMTQKNNLVIRKNAASGTRLNNGRGESFDISINANWSTENGDIDLIISERKFENN